MGILQSFQAIAPIFLLIILGLILRRKNIPGDDFWSLADRFAYWVLFPSLLFAKTSTIQLSGELIRPYALVIYGSFAAAVLYSLLVGKVLLFDGATTGSVAQGCIRHNSFLALGLAERFFGNEGLSQAIILSALLIPMTNIVSVTLMSLLVQKQGKDRLFKAIIKDLYRNPLLLGVLVGVSVNLLGFSPLPILNDAASLLGAAALPMMLVNVGANIRLDIMVVKKMPTVAAVIGKMLIFPLTAFALSFGLGLDGIPAILLILYGAVPTAASSYSLARQMGGDAPLMAAIITIQTGLAFFTIPISLIIARNYFM